MTAGEKRDNLHTDRRYVNGKEARLWPGTNTQRRRCSAFTTASKLFLEKGYEKTSLQDIIRETGLSKGAIYHHFSSKEAIFETICNQIGQENEIRLSKIRDDAALTGEEKLRKIFRSAILHPNQKEAFHIMPYLLDHPRYLAMQMQEILHISVPEYIQPILEEGVADGSLQVSDIQAVGEAIMVLMAPADQPPHNAGGNAGPLCGV